MQIQGFKGLGPILSITSDQEKGLKLSWNLNGIIAPNFQHYHVFLLLAESLSEPKLFLSAYFSQLRLGEIVGVCFYKDNIVESKIKIGWSEKSGCNSSIINLRKNNLLRQIHSKLIQQVCDNVEKKRGIVILNIYCDSQFSKKEGISKIVQNLGKTVSKIRDKGNQYDRIVFNLISERFKYSQINNNSGFNFFQCEPGTYYYCCSHLLAYIKTIYIKNLTITVQTKQKFHITSCSSNQWLIFDGMEMEKRYFAFPKTKFCEFINFYQTSKNPQFQISMNIGIKYSFYDGTEVRDNKTFQLKVSSNKDTIKNMNATTEMESLTLHEFKKGNFIRTNLLKQESHFIFSRIKELVKKKKKNTLY